MFIWGFGWGFGGCTKTTQTNINCSAASHQNPDEHGPQARMGRNVGGEWGSFVICDVEEHLAPVPRPQLQRAVLYVFLCVILRFRTKFSEEGQRLCLLAVSAAT